jgi:hypothetical protein
VVLVVAPIHSLVVGCPPQRFQPHLISPNLFAVTRLIPWPHTRLYGLSLSLSLSFSLTRIMFRLFSTASTITRSLSITVLSPIPITIIIMMSVFPFFTGEHIFIHPKFALFVILLIRLPLIIDRRDIIKRPFRHPSSAPLPTYHSPQKTLINLLPDQ